MRIGFDAKRAFHNQSGLGNYSRNLLKALSDHFGEHRYILYTPQTRDPLFDGSLSPFEIRKPERVFDKMFPSWWRTFGLTNQLINDRIDLYHGLSHELPVGIDRTDIRSVVTIHDLIFIRYPNLYSVADRFIYHRKFSHACRKAGRIIAVSRQTADDLIKFLGIRAGKIDVVYQAINPLFFIPSETMVKDDIRKRFDLPEHYILYVGTIEKRKNMLSLIKALHTGKIEIPLVAVGRKTSYFNAIEEYIEDHAVRNIRFIDEVKNEELPAIYQMADLFVYPSLFEGFGIPVQEALASGIPVITSDEGCFPEAGGPSSCYVNPLDVNDIASAIRMVLNDSILKKRMSDDGTGYALQFTPARFARDTMQVYEKALKR